MTEGFECCQVFLGQVVTGVCLQAGSQQALRDLRLQFAEHISLLTAERTSSDLLNMYQGKLSVLDLKAHLLYLLPAAHQ